MAMVISGIHPLRGASASFGNFRVLGPAVSAGNRLYRPRTAGARKGIAKTQRCAHPQGRISLPQGVLRASNEGEDKRFTTETRKLREPFDSAHGTHCVLKNLFLLNELLHHQHNDAKYCHGYSPSHASQYVQIELNRISFLFDGRELVKIFCFAGSHALDGTINGI